MSDCIFCKIIAGEIPAAKFRENDDYIAFLDLFPNRKGQALVIPKQHEHSDIFRMDDEKLSRYVLATKEVMEIMKKTFSVERIWLVAEGLEVPHAHFRLYPFWDNIGFEGNCGAGLKADGDELMAMAKKLQENG